MKTSRCLPLGVTRGCAWRAARPRLCPPPAHRGEGSSAVRSWPSRGPLRRREANPAMPRIGRAAAAPLRLRRLVVPRPTCKRSARLADLWNVGRQRGCGLALVDCHGSTHSVPRESPAGERLDFEGPRAPPRDRAGDSIQSDSGSELQEGSAFSRADSEPNASAAISATSATATTSPPDPPDTAHAGFPHTPGSSPPPAAARSGRHPVSARSRATPPFQRRSRARGC